MKTLNSVIKHMNRRIISVILCLVIAISLLGVGCNTDSNITAESSSEYSEESNISSGEQNETSTGSAPAESTSSDEWSEAPEDEWLFFPEDGAGAYFPSDSGSNGSSSAQSSSKYEDVFNIDTIPTLDNLFETENDSSAGSDNVSSNLGIGSNSSYERPSSSDQPYTPTSSSTHSNTPTSSTQSYTSQGSNAPTVEKPVYLDNNLSFSPLTANYDSLLDNNPDRGYRTELVLYIKEQKSSDDDPRTAYINDSESEIRKRVEKVFNIYFKQQYSTNKTFLAYIYITDFRDDDISKAAPVLEMFFKVCRERKVKSMLRFCYNNSYAKNYAVSQENKDLLASECADEATILKHIKQLKPYISKYKDTIHTISSGFVGFVGEWAYSYQYPHVDYATVMKAIVEELCVPNNLYFSSRSPSYKEMLDKDYKYRDYVSHNNDAMYGEQTRLNWNSGNYQYGHSNGWWDYVTREGAYTPQDGEMYTNDALYKYGMLPKGLEIILECAHHRHTSMSNWHGYLEALSRDNIMSRWINSETVTTSWLDSKKIIYDPNWFVDNNGNSVKRNPYEFLKDHLGYRLSAVGGHVKGECSKGSPINIELNLKNYGFAAAYMLSSGFAILDSNFKEVASVKAGNPEKWYSHAPNNSATSTVLTHTVNANIKLPSKSGKYYVAFYLKNTMNDRARLSNKLSFQNGYNVLFSFNL